jgi:hypothetical protein
MRLLAKSGSVAVWIACALAVYTLAVAVRWGVFGIQEARNGNIPFTMESALAFRYGVLSQEGNVSSQDTRVNVPEGLKPFESLNIFGPVLGAKAYVLARKIAPQSASLTLESFYHRFSPIAFSVGVLAIFGCAWALTGRLVLSVLAGLGYALLIPAVLRSTGQELMSENFSLPVLWTHLFCAIVAIKERASGNTRAFKFATIASALSLAFAWLLWDMIQVYVLLYVLLLVLLVIRPWDLASIRFTAGTFTATLFLAATGDSYLRTHIAWASLPLCFWAAFFVSAQVAGRGTSRFIWGWRAMGVFLVMTLLFCSFRGFIPGVNEAYNHFLPLLWYKLKFLNMKPLDPSLLPYEVRALWVPALHSATLARIWNYAGPAVLLWIVGTGLLGYRWMLGMLSGAEKVVMVLGLAFGFLAVLFVRMEVFWVFFASLGLVLATPKRWTGQSVWIGVLVAVLALETQALAIQAPGLGRDVDYASLSQLVGWVKRHTEPDAVLLASYSVSPNLAAYANRRIVLQPKYETALFREKIRSFERALIAPQESVFYSLCKDWGVRYYVHSRGQYADRSLNSFRYLVGVTQPSRETNLTKFEVNPKYLNRFRLLFQNEKYLVYRVISARDLRKSLFCLAMGQRSMAKGLPKRALLWCYRALKLYPGEDRARILAVKAFNFMGDVEGARRQAQGLFDRMDVQVMRQPAGTTTP